MSNSRRRVLRPAIAAITGLALLMNAGYACAGGAPPSIESESASDITATNATLKAQINPGDAPAGVYYQFQIANDLGEYLSEIVCPPEPPSGPAHPCIGAHSSTALPIGFVPAGSEPSSVSLDLSSAGVTLQPGKTYQYRVLVAKAVQSEDTTEWEAPSIIGGVQTLTTQPPPPPAAGAPDPQADAAVPPAIWSPLLSPPQRRHRRHRRHGRPRLRRAAVRRASIVG